MQLKMKIGGREFDMEIESDEETFRRIIKSGSNGAAEKIAKELDRVERERQLLEDERLLRRIIREEKYF